MYWQFCVIKHCMYLNKLHVNSVLVLTVISSDHIQLSHQAWAHLSLEEKLPQSAVSCSVLASFPSPRALLKMGVTKWDKPCLHCELLTASSLPDVPFLIHRCFLPCCGYWHPTEGPQTLCFRNGHSRTSALGCFTSQSVFTCSLLIHKFSGLFVMSM